MQFDRLRRRWLQDEVAELRKELAAARAELERLRGIDRAAKTRTDALCQERTPLPCHQQIV